MVQKFYFLEAQQFLLEKGKNLILVVGFPIFLHIWKTFLQ